MTEKLNYFLLIGCLVDTTTGKRFSREMSISTSKSYDQVSAEAERILIGTGVDETMEGYMLRPLSSAPSGGELVESTEPSEVANMEESRWQRAMSRAAEVVGRDARSTAHAYPPPAPITQPAKVLPIFGLPQIEYKAVEVEKIVASEKEEELCFV